MVGEMRLSNAAIEFGGTLMFPDCRFASVSTDTRRLAPGQLFVALRGDHFDAHDFLSQAAESACGLVVERPDRGLQVPQWVVPDTTLALGRIARLNRLEFTGKLLAVTGSAGKTTVKEMLAAILGNRAATLATRGNLNNQIGVPLTLLRLSPEHRFAVVEMGASAPGEIAYLCDVAQPDVALVNNILPAHVEGFGNVDAIAAAKGEIYDGLKSDGTAVLNLDEPYVEQWRKQLAGRHCMTYSLNNPVADVRAENISVGNLGRCGFRLVTPQGSCDIQLAVSGRHNVANALAAAAAALAAGAALTDVAAGLAAAVAVVGRMDLQVLFNGGLLIDDSYNANPGSVKAAIDTLLALPGKAILVLGDMAELGRDEIELHADVGRYAADKGVAALYTTGRLSRYASTAFGAGGRHFVNKRELVEALKPDIGRGVTVLVKGSRGAGMEEVVNALGTRMSNAEIPDTGE